MMEGSAAGGAFFGYPHTPHLTWLGEGAPRGDKVLKPYQVEEFLYNPVLVEEKVDGANLGFSLGADGVIRAQNRGEYLQRPFSGQFQRLNQWLTQNEDRLFDTLEPGWTVFGEWCAARHSVAYDRLPDWWLAFDVFDLHTGAFATVAGRNQWASEAGLNVVHPFREGRFSLGDLRGLLETAESAYRSGPPEGLFIRQIQRRSPDGQAMARAKLVRPEFLEQINEHWARRPFEWNRLAGSTRGR